MVNEVMDFITGYDKEVGEAIQAECARQRRNLELIASENIVSEPVMMAMGTVLTNKYAEGYSGKRYYGGCQCVDVVETLAIERADELKLPQIAQRPAQGIHRNTVLFSHRFFRGQKGIRGQLTGENRLNERAGDLPAF